MARDQKTKAKASQKPKQRVAATQTRDATQTITNTATDETQITNGTTIVDDAPITDDMTITNGSDATSNAQAEPTAVEQSHEPLVWSGLQPSWPSWPTSKPGPRSTPPIPGMRPMNAFRSEQFKEMGYNQQTGEPATQSAHPDESTNSQASLDQPLVQNTPGRGKQRL